MLIGTGLVVARSGDGKGACKHVVRDSLYGALALEGFLLLYAYHRTHGAGRAEAMAEHAPPPAPLPKVAPAWSGAAE